MYILITAASSAEAYKLKGTLSGDILLGDYLDLPDLLVRSGKVIKLPNPGGNAYTHEMLALCLDKEINAIYPLLVEEKELLLNSKQLFLEYDIDILVAGDQIQ